MNVTAYKTHKIAAGEELFSLLDTYLPKLEENSVVVIASKIVGICEGRVVKKISDEQKKDLIKQEAEQYVSQEHQGFLLTQKNCMLVVNAGIDESNSNGYLSLWPKDPQKSANAIREYLVKKYHLTNLGVILTDSKLTPLRYGVTAYAIASSGFEALKSYINKPDIFGNPLQAEKANIADSLATAASIVMGEGAEQQPLAVVTDVPFITFLSGNPTEEEREKLKIQPEDDIYGSLLTAVTWKKKR